MVLAKFHPALTFWGFGARESFGYLGLCTARDLFISGEFSRARWPWGTPSVSQMHQVDGTNRVYSTYIICSQWLLRQVGSFNTKNLGEISMCTQRALGASRYWGGTPNSRISGNKPQKWRDLEQYIILDTRNFFWFQKLKKFRPDENFQKQVFFLFYRNILGSTILMIEVRQIRL